MLLCFDLFSSFSSFSSNYIQKSRDNYFSFERGEKKINVPYLIQPTDYPDPLSTKRSGCGLVVVLTLLVFHRVVAIIHPSFPSLDSTLSCREDSRNFPSQSPPWSEHPPLLRLLPIRLQLKLLIRLYIQ